MSGYTSHATERFSIQGGVFPVSANSTTKSTDYVDMTKFARAVFILQLGATDTTTDMALHAAKTIDNGDSSDAAITGFSITQLSGTDDNHYAVIEISGEALHRIMGNGFNYVKALITVSNATAALVSAVALGFDPRYASASDYNLTTVKQIVTP